MPGSPTDTGQMYAMDYWTTDVPNRQRNEISNRKIGTGHMSSEKPRSTGATSQIERFKETARTLGCDEDEAAFKAKLAVIARQKPKDEQPAVQKGGPAKRSRARK